MLVVRGFRCPLEMGFRGPDGIGDKYHFVSNVAKRSGLIHARRPRQLSISNNTRTVEAVARLASSSICGVHREIGNRHEARAQTRVEHQERHGLQADRARKIPTFRVGRSPSAARFSAAAQAGSTAADTKIDFR